MKKFATIFFLFIFLIANTALGEILKSPVLILHYKEHKQENNCISFIDFLAKHYAKEINHSHNDNHHDHERLPFKTVCSHFTQIVPAVLKQSFSFSEIIPQKATAKISVRHNFGYSQLYLNSIWHPPRF